VRAIFDASCSRDLTLVESCVEFITRYRQNQLVDDERSKSSLPMIASACPGMEIQLISVLAIVYVKCEAYILDSRYDLVLRLFKLDMDSHGFSFMLCLDEKRKLKESK